MFVAVYWWRVHPGKEAQFEQAWHRGTELITRIYGSYGSRLHRERDGRFVGYAMWPDEARWQAAMAVGMAYDEPETRARFVESIADSSGDRPAFLMTVIDDLLVETVGGDPTR